MELATIPTTAQADAAAPAPAELPALTKVQMWDLYKMDRDARKSMGFGFFPKVYSDILERYFAVGDIDVEKANATLAEFFRAKPDEL